MKMDTKNAEKKYDENKDVVDILFTIKEYIHNTERQYGANQNVLNYLKTLSRFIHNEIKSVGD